MAIKTFSVGEVLTATDTNTYLANSGLVYVTSQSFTSASTASPVNVVDCFTNTYLNYMAKLTISSGSSNAEVRIQLLDGTTPATGTDYRTAGTGSNNSSATSNDGNIARTFVPFTFNTQNGTGAGQVEFYQPKAAIRTTMITDWLYSDATILISRRYGALHNLANSYTGFRIFPDTGTITGVVTVYGYRQA